MNRFAAAMLAVLLAAGPVWPAWAGHKTIDPNNLKKQVDLPAGAFGESFDMRLIVEQVYNPGMSDKRGCRMQIFFYNDSKVTVNLRVLINTFDQLDQPADVNLVPSGPLPPGKMVMRLLSCLPANTVEVSRDTSFGWPQVCDVNGAEQVPCPVALHFSSTMGILNEP